MAAPAQVVPAAPAEVLPFFEACADGLRQGAQLPEVIAGSRCYALQVGDERVFAWALSQVGNECWIDAAAGHAPGIDLTAVGLAIIEAQARGLDTVAFMTHRRGLVKRAQKLGYEIDGIILRKKLK